MANDGMSINKVSFYLIVTLALLYVVSMILSLVGVASRAVAIMQAVAAAIMILVVATLAWRYVQNRTTVWKILYVICVLLVIVGIVIPLVF